MQRRGRETRAEPGRAASKRGNMIPEGHGMERYRIRDDWPVYFVTRVRRGSPDPADGTTEGLPVRCSSGLGPGTGPAQVSPGSARVCLPLQG